MDDSALDSGTGLDSLLRSPEGAAIKGPNRLGGRRTAKFLLGVAAIALALVAFSYLDFSIGGVLRRESSSLSGTEWMSWEAGTLSFAESTVTHASQASTRTLPYEERFGSVVIDGTEKPYMILTRMSSNKLMTSDGKLLFYLRGSLPVPTGSKTSQEASE